MVQVTFSWVQLFKKITHSYKQLIGCDVQNHLKLNSFRYCDTTDEIKFNLGFECKLYGIAYRS